MFKDSQGNFKLKIAFDYDDTLTHELFFNLAKRLVDKGHDVWILTVRTSDEQYFSHCQKLNITPKSEPRNLDLWADARELGIENKVIFTDSEDKLSFYQNHGFDLLFDDDADWHCNPICENGGFAIHI